MLTRCSFSQNTEFPQNKRMIYALHHRQNLFSNQIFRHLILINGPFNVIVLLNIHCNVAAANCETLFSYSSTQCFSPPALRHSVITLLVYNKSVIGQATSTDKGNLCPLVEHWELLFSLLSDQFNLGDKKPKTKKQCFKSNEIKWFKLKWRLWVTNQSCGHLQSDAS